MISSSYPRISIVTPCFNHESFVAETIESVISQGYPNLQYIVINDGSTDKSGEVIRNYEQNISILIENESFRPGPVWALNEGFAQADGEILGWISSDDILLRKSLFTIAKVFEDLPQVEWVTGLASTINSRGEVVNCLSRPVNRYDYLCGDWQVIQQESTFFRRSLWRRAGGKLDERWVQAFDTELWTRFFLTAEHYQLMAPLGAFRKGQQSRSVRAVDEFLLYNERALAVIKKQIGVSDRLKSLINGFLHIPAVSSVFRMLPSRLMMWIGLIDRYIHYDFQHDRWRVRSMSSLRRSF